MSEIIEMHANSFDLLAKNMPKDAKKIHNLEGSEAIVSVQFAHAMSVGPYIVAAFIGNKELGLSFDDRDDLEAMAGFYQDNQRQDEAEGGA